MNRDNFEEQPQWLRELWELDPSIARKAENYINELARKLAAQPSRPADDWIVTEEGQHVRTIDPRVMARMPRRRR